MATVPTVADLRARRLDLTTASIRERLLAGGLDDVRVVIDTLAQEFDVVDIAAAAVKLAHEELAGQDADEELPPAPGPPGPGGRARTPRTSPTR